MIEVCDKFITSLEKFVAAKLIAFGLGKTDFSIDPNKLDNLKIKADFEIKENIVAKIAATFDKSQTKIDDFKKGQTDVLDGDDLDFEEPD